MRYPKIGAIRRFIADERGVGTMWAILWLILLFGVGGMAVDVTYAFRTQTQLQATADAAALAGAINLPKNDTQSNQPAVASAVNMAYKNMYIQENGTVLQPAEVAIGDWDHANHTLVAQSGKLPTAVFVTTRRDDHNQNPVPMMFLRILGTVAPNAFNHWNVYAQAAAEYFVPECLTHSGLVARGVIDYQSNNVFAGDFCIHSQQYVKVSNHNQYGPAVTVSMPNRGDLRHGTDTLDTNPGVFNTNYYVNHDGPGATQDGYLVDRVASTILDPKMVDQIDMLIQTFRTPSLDDADQLSNVIPDYLRTNAVGSGTTATITPVKKSEFNANGGGKNAPPTDGWQYAFDPTGPDGWNADGLRQILIVGDDACTGNGNKTITIGNKDATNSNPLILKDLAIVTKCKINVTSNVEFVNVALISSYADGNMSHDSINFAGDDQLGYPDDCQPGGGMFIVAAQSISSPAKLRLDGVQAVAGGNIAFAANGTGLYGINFQAGGTISVTSNEAYGGTCEGGMTPVITSHYYRLVY